MRAAGLGRRQQHRRRPETTMRTTHAGSTVADVVYMHSDAAFLFPIVPESNLISFCSLHPDSNHAGLPVLAGDKWACNLWYRESPMPGGAAAKSRQQKLAQPE